MSLNRARFRYTGAEEVRFDYYAGLPIDFPTGAAEIAATISTARAPDGIGALPQITSVPARPITINGYIIQSPSTEPRRKLERAFAPLAEGRLWAVTEDEEEFFLGCISTAAPTIEGKVKYPRFQISLSANYPYWQGANELTAEILLTGQTTTASVEIQSDAPALFRLEITGTGAASGITLTDVEGGGWIRYTGTLAAGKTLAIAVDGVGRVIATAGGQDVIGMVSGEMKKLQPGKRKLTISADFNAGTLTAKIIYREARAGV